MPSFYVDMRNCGSTGAFSTLLGLLGIVLALIALVLVVARSPNRQTAPIVVASLALALGANAIVLGPIGKQWDLGMVAAATASEGIDPLQRTRIRAEGAREADACVSVGFEAGALPVIVGMAALLTALMKRKNAKLA